MKYSVFILLPAFCGFLKTDEISSSNEISKIELYVHSLQLLHPTSTGIVDLADSSYFRGCIEIELLPEIQKYIATLKKKKPKKKRIQDFRVLLIITYKNGDVEYIGKGSVPLVYYNNKIYKDKDHLLYRIINKSNNKIKTIQQFLQDYDQYK